MNSFISYCNNNDIASAYNLLSDGCKKELFNTQNDFKQKYYDKIFTSKKDYNIEAWKYTGVGVTYRVTFSNDILSFTLSKFAIFPAYVNLSTTTTL